MENAEAFSRAVLEDINPFLVDVVDQGVFAADGWGEDNNWDFLLAFMLRRGY